MRNRSFSRRRPVAIVLPALCVLLLATACMGTSRPGTLQEFQFVRNFPVRAYKEQDSVRILNFRDTTSIVYMDAYALYRLPAVTQFETNQSIRGTEAYLLMRRGAGTGRFFSSGADASPGVVVNVDSFLRKKGLQGEDFDVPADSAWQLVATTAGDRPDEVLEKYAYTRPPTETVFDSIYYYYSKRPPAVDFSFSKKLDRAKRMKLSRVRFLYNERYSTQEQFMVPKREFLFDLREVEPGNPEDTRRLLRRLCGQAGI
ncbi:MAG: hypothetical protein EOO11_11205 [Chitinophagaceae bacterium]|nr:MAG: hypothetical protein EOO11_11205 [Chitinophagaceae bacterium]